MGFLGKVVSIGTLVLGGVVVWLLVKPKVGYHYFTKKYYTVTHGIRFEGAPGKRVAISPGSEYGLELSFRHRASPGKTLKAYMTLLIGTQAQTAYSEPFETGYDPTWEEYGAVCKSTEGFKSEGLEHCRLISVEYGLIEVDSGAVVFSDTDAECFHIVTEAEYIRQETRVMSYWSDTGGEKPHISGQAPLVRIQQGDNYGGTLQVKRRYAGGIFKAELMLDMESGRWEVASGEVTLPPVEQWETFSIPCIGHNFNSYGLPKDRRIDVVWKLYRNGLLIMDQSQSELELDKRDKEVFVIGDFPDAQFTEFLVSKYESESGGMDDPGRGVLVQVGDKIGARGVTFKHIGKGGIVTVRLKVHYEGNWNTMQTQVQTNPDHGWTQYAVDIPLQGSFQSYGAPDNQLFGVHKELELTQNDGKVILVTDTDANCYQLVGTSGYLRQTFPSMFPLVDEYAAYPGGYGVPGSLIPIYSGVSYGCSGYLEHKGKGGQLKVAMKIRCVAPDYGDNIIERTTTIENHADWTRVDFSLHPHYSQGGQNFNPYNNAIGQKLGVSKFATLSIDEVEVASIEDLDYDCYKYMGEGEPIEPPPEDTRTACEKVSDYMVTDPIIMDRYESCPYYCIAIEEFADRCELVQYSCPLHGWVSGDRKVLYTAYK